MTETSITEITHGLSKIASAQRVTAFSNVFSAYATHRHAAATEAVAASVHDSSLAQYAIAKAENLQAEATSRQAQATADVAEAINRCALAFDAMTSSVYAVSQSLDRISQQMATLAFAATHPQEVAVSEKLKVALVNYQQALILDGGMKKEAMEDALGIFEGIMKYPLIRSSWEACEAYAWLLWKGKSDHSAALSYYKRAVRNLTVQYSSGQGSLISPATDVDSACMVSAWMTAMYECLLGSNAHSQAKDLFNEIVSVTTMFNYIPARCLPALLIVKSKIQLKMGETSEAKRTVGILLSLSPSLMPLIALDEDLAPLTKETEFVGGEHIPAAAELVNKLSFLNLDYFFCSLRANANIESYGDALRLITGVDERSKGLIYRNAYIYLEFTTPFISIWINLELLRHDLKKQSVLIDSHQAADRTGETWEEGLHFDRSMNHFLGSRVFRDMTYFLRRLKGKAFDSETFISLGKKEHGAPYCHHLVFIGERAICMPFGGRIFLNGQPTSTDPEDPDYFERMIEKLVGVENYRLLDFSESDATMATQEWLQGRETHITRDFLAESMRLQ